MTEFKTSSLPEYENWIQSPPQRELAAERDWLALNQNRRALLKGLLAPYREAVCEAATNLKLHLEKIDQALSAFMRLRQHATELIADYSGLFTQLKPPLQLQTVPAQMLLDEYTRLVIESPAADSTNQVGGALEALNQLAADLEQPMRNELASRTRLADHALQEVLSLLNDTQTIANLRRLLDTDLKSVGTVFSELISALETLGSTLHASHPNEPLVERTLENLRAIQGSCSKLSDAISGYDSPNGSITSAQLKIRELKDTVKTLSQQLPPAAFQLETPRTNRLSTLPPEKKRAALIVLRQLDTLDEISDAKATSIDIAHKERDQLIHEMLRLYDAQIVYSLVTDQAHHFTEHYPQLVSSLNSAITEAKAEFDYQMLSIACEHGLAEDLASYIARQQLNAEAQNAVIALFCEYKDLSSICSSIIKYHGSLPISSPEDLRRYLDNLSEVITSARALSPVALESFISEPNKELSTHVGLTRYAETLISLRDNPAQLMAYEHAYLESKITAILHTNFSQLYETNEKCVEAARILIFNFVPEDKSGKTTDVVRDSKTIISRYKRYIGSDLRTEQLQEAIARLANANILVLSNRGERDLAKRRYRIASQQTPALNELHSCLKSMANRSATPKQQPPAKAPLTAIKEIQASDLQTTPSRMTKAISPKHTPTADELNKIKTNRLKALSNFITEKLPEFDEKIALASTSSPLAKQSQTKLNHVSILSSRLLSSVTTEPTIIGAAKFKNSLESKCFRKLSDKVGARVTVQPTPKP
jgi:hypothetical protein